VRWSDDGRVSRLFPGPDAFIEHFPAASEPAGDCSKYRESGRRKETAS
jgi:hypothetical protein